MFRNLNSSKDAYITNKSVKGKRKLSSNTGGAATLDLFKLRQAAKVDGNLIDEISRILIKFDIEELKDNSTEIIYQITDWFIPETDKPIIREDYEKSNEYSIYIFGTNNENITICTKVINFKPYFYIKPPSSWEDLNDKDRPLRCGHTFHRSCWNRWKQTKNQCPICRTNFEPNKNENMIDLSSVDLTEENISLIAILISQVTGLPEQTARNIIREVGGGEP